ncbi:putative metal-binding protein [Ancylobacter sp. 3268]|uniref:(2Fe-2S) ferredoxin domain-containing protein n=1 Tax=Ancylobacter sp. 3268 TaxID=2817752 RepID=UPI0028672B54|nr:(2Fe-2S) ferredoxin domain-containing protein [Ancylobacter sp. 3268]MDR6952938.1 putative metal-binding protein [Ancylobacter sp. 3268]
MKPIASNWTDVVLVCRKCAKKLKKGFGEAGDDRLAPALRGAVARRDGGKPMKKPRRKGTGVAVVEVDCLGVCPKGAAVVVPAGAPERWRLVRHGDDLATLLDELAPRRTP